MCGCLGHEVCSYHFAVIERAYLEARELEKNEQSLSVDDYERLRQLRGRLLFHGLKTEIVIHRIKTREWEARNAA